MGQKRFTIYRNGILLICIATVLSSCSCSRKDNSQFPYLYVDEVPDIEKIEDYHAGFFPGTKVLKPNDSPSVYIDLSDGITVQSLGNKNNKDIYEKLLRTIAVDNDFEYFELSSDEVLKYEESDKFNYFTKTGLMESDGRVKTGAPIDIAINEIVEKDNVGILITDGELYNKEKQVVDASPWASSAFSKWLNKGYELFFVYTDFIENNHNLDYKKHMYIMFFIPDGLAEVKDKYIKELDDAGFIYKTLSFSTNRTDLFIREYTNSSSPGADKFIELFGDPLAYYASDDYPFEYIDLSTAEFNFDKGGLVYYLRDIGDNNGNPMNFPILNKLYFDFNKMKNYKVENLKIVIHDVYDDFKNYKKYSLAVEHPPSIMKNLSGGDSLAESNYFLFQGMPLIDDVEPYDTAKVTINDTINSFAPILKNEFNYEKNKVTFTNKGILDFIVLDEDAGEISEINDQTGRYEIVLKLSGKLNGINQGLSSERENLVRIDVIIEDIELNPIDEEALTWEKIDGSGTDEALYTSLRLIMNSDDVKPKGVIYSYYVKLGPFNQ